MSITIESYTPTEMNKEEILNISCDFNEEERERFEDTVIRLKKNHDGFKELHLIMIENKIIGFSALNGPLPCVATNYIGLETVYILIGKPYRGQGLSNMLVDKYILSIENWIIAALKAPHTKSYREIVLHQSISAISIGGGAYAKKSRLALAEWC